MNTLKNIFAALAVLAAGVLVGWCGHGHFAPDKNVETKRDTTITVDTNVYVNPPAISFDINIDESIEVPASELVINNDSLVVLPMEVKKYKGDGYEAQVSGYNPRLDWINVFPETKYITTKETIFVKSRKRWGIGIQAGYGVIIEGGRIVPAPYIGVGISYNLIRF